MENGNTNNGFKNDISSLFPKFCEIKTKYNFLIRCQCFG